MRLFSKNKEYQFINKKENKIIKYSLFFVGCLLNALSYNILISPNHLVPGGVGGIAIIVNSLTGMNNSTIILVLNIFLLILSYFIMGKEKTRATVLGALTLPILIKLTENFNIWVGLDTSQILLSTIFGGICTGLGLGILFREGFTTGGTDIINQIFSKTFKIGIGTSMLLSDGIIVLASGLFFGFNNLLYSILLLYIISIMSDRVILGISDNKMCYIVSEKDNEIKEYIIDHLHHGATIYNVKGGFKHKKGNIIMTVIPTREFSYLKDSIDSIDNEAFYLITDSYEMFGGK